MFDPTIFENLKVGFENYVYDLDNLSKEVEVVDRQDILDMAVMERKFSITFHLSLLEAVKAEIVLKSSVKDLAAEILESPDGKPGCSLFIYFYKQVHQVEEECKTIQALVEKIWDQEKKPIQTLSFVHDQKPVVFENRIEVSFNRQINEEQMGDIPELIDYVLHTLEQLHKV
ncbi:hypothetical protein [Halalkalibacter krulwichiae]|uniref:Group-specific protein n=1 Tax=Halalkalibacter krulwichiae TaxID=199441 RepID=A0A1X9M650_9BACI|nr:hypothetical protein [Halalkalibacter krulwichiae]ARK28928.1 hypothetical protein BkAM31D_03110 [Halalkalibacter krulwichiae]